MSWQLRLYAPWIGRTSPLPQDPPPFGWPPPSPHVLATAEHDQATSPPCDAACACQDLESYRAWLELHFWAQQQQTALDERRTALAFRIAVGLVMLAYVVISLMHDQPPGYQLLRALGLGG